MSFQENLSTRISELEQERYALQLKLRRVKAPKEDAALKAQAKELTFELVNRLITKIEVFDSTKDENGKKQVPIKIHFIGVAVIVIPDRKTILETYEEIRKNPPRVA